MKKIEEPLIDDIMTTGLVYFDDAIKEECAHFCEVRHIEFLPALDSNSHYYEFLKETKTFERKEIPQEMKINHDAPALCEETFEQFSKAPLLIVYKQNEIQGLIHFCDYNRNPIKMYFYERISEYEKNLRSFLVLQGLNNKDMHDFFAKYPKNQEYERNLKEYLEKEAEIKISTPFAFFTINHLVGLINSRNLMHLPEIKELRNVTMHPIKRYITLKNYQNQNLEFNYDTFEIFKKECLQLKINNRKVENRINLSKQPKDLRQSID